MKYNKKELLRLWQIFYLDVYRHRVKEIKLIAIGYNLDGRFITYSRNWRNL